MTAGSTITNAGEHHVPLDFLKRKGQCRRPTPRRPTTSTPSSSLMPEEVVAQDHQLKLYYAGKSSEGVRLKAGPAAHRRAADDAGRSRPLGDRGRRAAAHRVQPGDADHRQPVRSDAVAQRPSRPLADHPARAGRPRIDRRGRSRLRHVRLRAARRRGRHVRLPGVQRDRRRRRGALGRGDRRHDLPRRRRLGRQGRPRRHGPDRREAPGRHPEQHPRQPVRARA